MAFSTIAAAALAALLLPLLLLLWALGTPASATDAPPGHSYRAIGRRLGCARTTARRYCLA